MQSLQNCRQILLNLFFHHKHMIPQNSHRPLKREESFHLQMPPLPPPAFQPHSHDYQPFLHTYQTAYFHGIDPTHDFYLEPQCAFSPFEDFNQQNFNAYQGHRNMQDLYGPHIPPLKLNPFSSNVPLFYDDEMPIKKEEEEKQQLWAYQNIKHEPSNFEDQILAHPYQPRLYTPQNLFPSAQSISGQLRLKESAEKSLVRKQKVAAYLEKKKQRTYCKKIMYKCRKDVADSRIRLRGRFMSTKQAAVLLGLDPERPHDETELKQQILKLLKKNEAL